MNAAKSILLAAILCLTSFPAVSQENPLFFGDWYSRMDEIARGERIPIKQGDLVVEPGWIVWYRPTGGVYYRARYRIIKDLGDRLVVKMATVYEDEPSRESIEIQTMALRPDDQHGSPSFDGRPQIHLTLYRCPSGMNEAFARHVLAADTPEEIWQRILKAPLEEDSLWKECRMTEEGEWYDRNFSFSSFGRFTKVDEHEAIDSDPLKIFPHWPGFFEPR